MNDISDDAGDIELALAMEEQVNARVLRVLEQVFNMGAGTMTTYAADPKAASYNLYSVLAVRVSEDSLMRLRIEELARSEAASAIELHRESDHGEYMG